MKKHKLTAKKLDNIIKKAFGLIFNKVGKIYEYDVAQFILEEFTKENLEIDRQIPIPIVASGDNTQYVHYHPKKSNSRLIKKNDLIMLDIWAKSKEGGHFADVTWMGFTGKNINQEYVKIFNLVVGARGVAIKFIRRHLKNKILPGGEEIDLAVRNYFKKYGLEKKFLHGAGHSLGQLACHGQHFRLAPADARIIKQEIPFTVEPGLYFKNKFGIRSEINCYVDKDYRLIITSKIQSNIINFLDDLSCSDAKPAKSH